MTNSISGSNYIRNIIKFLKDENGATAIEYGLIASLIAVVIVAALGSLGTGVQTTFTNIAASL